jgi:prepilin-type processing-associated H-X9-DG protein
MTQISDGMDDGDSEDLEIKVASMKYVQRLSDALLTALDPKPVGNQVTMNADLKVGVAEIGMLTGLMLPAVHGARDAARRAQSQNNLKQIALSFHNHHDMKKTFPATANYDANGKPLLSWRVHMLPLLEENQLYQQFHLDEPWDSEHNKKLVEQMPAVYKHPKFDQPGKTVYLAVVGKGAAFEGKEGQKIRTFTDGTSKTIMVVEVTPEKAVPWTKPEDWEFDAENQIDMNDFGGLSAGDIFNAVFADGHVQALTRSIDPEAFKTMLTRNGGEVIPLP